jgi:AAA+ ATPase superfamily predicted ATPase
MSFFGREQEIRKLMQLKQKNKASLVCVLGRRRIGKSFLIQQLGKKYKKYFEVQGLGPNESESNTRAQLDHFAFELSEQFNIKRPYFRDWDEALSQLAELTKSNEVLILLDEISWMGKGDPFFAAKIKSAWDSRFKKNPKLMLVLCGSVSAWIEKNILNDTSFEGRISLELNIKELELPQCNRFFSATVGDFEKMIALSITGGVPKYLEEIPKDEPISRSMANLCFSPSEILFNDFRKIFNDIFQRKSKTYEKIVRAALDRKLSPLELAKKAKIEYNSDFLEAIHHLELSGFLSRDYYFNPIKNDISKFSCIRVKDNYLRFYIKQIEPLKEKILSGGISIQDLRDLKGIESILGFQFENLILANKHLIHKELKIEPNQLVASTPYSQKKTTLNKGACQVDLLIQTQLDVFFVCEFKCQKKIGKKIINEVQRKIDVLHVPKRSSIKPILVYMGDLDPEDEAEIMSYFYNTIYFGDLLK